MFVRYTKSSGYPLDLVCVNMLLDNFYTEVLEKMLNLYNIRSIITVK